MLVNGESLKLKDYQIQFLKLLESYDFSKRDSTTFYKQDGKCFRKRNKISRRQYLKVCNKGMRSFKIYSKISQQAKERLISEGFNVQEYDS